MLARIRRRIEPSFGHYGEIREELEAFVQRFAGQPVAADATETIKRLDIDYAKLAEEELKLAQAAAREFVSRGDHDQAASMLRSMRSRFGDGPWLASSGEEKIRAAEKEIADARDAKAAAAVASAKDSVAKAEDALSRDDTRGAREALSGRDAWPDEERRRAEDILRKTAEREKALAAERERANAWPVFLAAFAEAGDEGLGKAEALVARERSRLEELGLRDRLARIRGLLRDAKFTESIAVEGFLATSARTRLHRKEKPYSGKVLKVEGGVITLKPVVGDAVEIPIADIKPEEVTKAAGLLKGDARSRLKAAGYYIVRRELDAAGKAIEGIAGQKASALREDIRAFADAIAAAAAAKPAPVAGSAKPEPGTDSGARGAAAPASRKLRDELKIAPAGNIGIANAWMYVHFAAPGWKSSVTQTGAVAPNRGFPTLADGKWRVRGKFNSPKTPATFDFEQTVEDLEADSVRYHARLTNPAGVDTESLFLTIGLPVPALAGKEVAFDDRTQVFPKEKLPKAVFGGQNIRRTIIPVRGGRIVVEGEYNVYVQDSRNHGSDCFEIRLMFNVDGRVVKKAELDVTMRFEAGASDVVASRSAGGAAKPPAPEPAPQEGPKEPLPGETGMPGQWAPGLIAEIFESPKFKKRLGARIDGQIDYFMGVGGLDPCMDNSNRTVRWTGMLLIPSDGKYIFDVDCQRSQMAVTLDGSPLIKKGKAKVTLQEEYKAGLHPLTVTYYGKGWWGAARFRWLPPWGKKVAVPAEYLFHEVPELGTNGPHAKLVQGVWAEYFKGDGFAQKVAENHARLPVFDFGVVPPVPGLPRNRWCARFTGRLLVDKDEEVGFSAFAEGGVRVKFDGSVLIDQWENAKGKEFKAKRKGVKKGFRDIVVDYRHRGGNAKLQVKCAMTHDGNRDNPKDLSSCDVFHEPREALLVNRRGLAPGMKGGIFLGEKPVGRPVLRHWSPAALLDWRNKSPGEKVPADRFSGAWEGVLVAPRTGHYTFRAHQKGGLMLTVGRQQAAGSWRAVEEVNDKAVVLKKGKNDVRMAYFNRSGEAMAQVWWSGPGFGMGPLTSDVLGHSAPKLAMAEPWKPAPPAPAPVAGGQAGGVDAGREAAKPPGERPPEGNLVANGGFEERNEDTRFAARWSKGQWGKRGARYSVRLDRSNPKTGDSALSLRGLEAGAEAGASTTLKLVPATYEVRFWACAAIGKNADVLASLAGRNLPAFTVGDEYKQFTARIEITKKELQAALRIRLTTPTGRVWLDDVEIEAVQ
jgi:hypothetical protein